jgi:hypothetical protein
MTNKEAESCAPNWKERASLIGILENRFLRVPAATLVAFMMSDSIGVFSFLFFPSTMFVWWWSAGYLPVLMGYVPGLLKFPRVAFIIITAVCIYRGIGKTILPCLKRKPEKANAICGFYLFYMLCNPFLICAFMRVLFVEILEIRPIGFVLSMAIMGLSLLLTCAALYGVFRIPNWLYKKIFDDPIGMGSKYKV